MASVANPLEVFFDLVLTGAALYAPIYDAQGKVVDFRFVRLNPAGQRLLGLPAQPPRTFCEYYLGSVPTGIFAQYRQAYLTGQASTYDVSYVGDGFDTYFRLVAQRSGELLVVNFTDMADLPRSAAEQALRDRRARELAEAQAATERQRRQWEELFRRAPAAISISDGPAWVYEFVNPGYQALFPGRKLLGRPVLEALPELAGQPLLDILHHVYDTGEPFMESGVLVLVLVLVLVPLARTDDGPVEDRYSDLTYQARHSETGQINGLVTYANEVTEQIWARREREAQQGELQRIFEQAPVAIAVFRGPGHIIELANDMQLAIWDRTKEEALGKGLFELLPEVVAQGFEQIIDGVMATGQPYVGVDAPASFTRHGVREEIFVSFVHHPLREADGRISGVIAVITNTTEQVRARQQVQLLNQELTVANQELLASNTRLRHTNVDLDNFIYTASHDLKAPIANIEGLLALLQRQLPAELLRAGLVPRILGMMQGAIARFQLTISQLTDLTRLQQMQTEAAQPAHLATVLEAVRLDLAPLLEATGVQLTVNIDACETVRFAPQYLRSVIYNLLSNAVKYRHPARVPRVQLRCYPAAQTIVLEVADNGLGLSDQQQSKLFRLFERLHGHVEGSGVGLYMVKRIVENMDGTIAVRSELGVGTTFVLTFPA